MNIGSIGYSISAIAFFIFFTVLLTDKQKGAAKILLVIAAFSSSVWSFSMSYQAMTGSDFITPQVLEFVKSISWIALLLKMLSVTYGAGITTSSFKVALGSIIIFVVFMMLPVMYQYHNQGITTFGDSFNYLLASHLLLAVIGIVLIEQLYRNTRPEQRWVIMFLCLGLGGMYVYDFYMYSDGLLYKRIDLTLWYARGFVDALVVPLIGVAITRDQLWSPEIFISRKVVFRTTSLLAGAIYLMTMGVAGYYVRDYGGSWGLVGQAFLLSFTILSLSLLLFSKRIRARWKVLLNKHFYPYKYDYREEWLGFIKNISTIGDDTSLYQKTIKSIAQIIDSPGGMLWLRQKSGSYECIETLRMPCVKIIESSQSPLVKFLDENEFVISIDEFKESPEVYNRLGFIELPDWINEVTPWLIVPLIHIDELIGFIVLDHSVAQKKHFNWEDSDLLKTAARQAASFIVQREVSEQLAEAKQFESYNKLATYMVHDIKNLVTQLSLITSNAEKHKNNPLFMDDLREEFNKVKNNKNKLFEFHNKLRSLTFFDPACGCGNFLVIAYRELRLLELDVLRASNKGGQLSFDVHQMIQLDVDQFYGIEIEEFPAQIAQVALWLMDHQMNLIVSEEFGMYFARIPLTSTAKIVNDNALRIDWKDVIEPEKLSFIMGNPPFLGKQYQSKDQKSDYRTEPFTKP